MGRITINYRNAGKCGQDGCNEIAVIKGYCAVHYVRRDPGVSQSNDIEVNGNFNWVNASVRNAYFKRKLVLKKHNRKSSYSGKLGIVKRNTKNSRFEKLEIIKRNRIRFMDIL